MSEPHFKTMLNMPGMHVVDSSLDMRGEGQQRLRKQF